MSVNLDEVKAMVASEVDDEVHFGLDTITADSLANEEVTIEVEYSSVNYKDMLALRAGSKVVSQYPIIPGIDLAGTVVESSNPDVAVGTAVLAHGYRLGTAHNGGYAEYARVPADWVVPLNRITTEEAMLIGTAGFTAAMSVCAIHDEGIDPSRGQVLVTGATGGVATTAIDMLSALGYDVVASTGKQDLAPKLNQLGAHETIGRIPEDAEAKIRPLSSASWAAAVDTVGGRTLAYLLTKLSYGGLVAASGNAAGIDLPATVMPFILRGVTLKGIDSVMMSIEERRDLWQRIETDLFPQRLASVSETVDIKNIDAVMQKIQDGTHLGRTVIKVKGGF